MGCEKSVEGENKNMKLDLLSKRAISLKGGTVLCIACPTPLMPGDPVFIVNGNGNHTRYLCFRCGDKPVCVYPIRNWRVKSRMTTLYRRTGYLMREPVEVKK